jgi:hypothetical protein
MTRISAHEVTRNISEILDRVRKDRERFEVSGGTQVFARIEPWDERPTLSGREFFQWFTARRWLRDDDSHEFETQLQQIRKASGWADRRWD